MKRSSTIFLQVAVVLVGIGVLTFMLWEPHLEGRNVHATLFQIYFTDPFLACAYIASIPFFVALYQAFKLLEHIGRNEASSERSVRALRTIKYCGMSLVASLVAAEAYLWIIVRGKDDIAGGVAVGLFLIFVSVAIATAAAVFERLLSALLAERQQRSISL